MSKIEVNTVDVQCGSTLTLGSSGKTVTLATGASQSGFGRTGTVDWCTTAKTGDFTAVSGDGFFVDTNLGAITVTLPSSPSAGNTVIIKNVGAALVTVGRNSSNIDSVAADGSLPKGNAVQLVYVDSTIGWASL